MQLNHLINKVAQRLHASAWRSIVSSLSIVVVLASPLYGSARPNDNQCVWQGSASNAWSDSNSWSNCSNGTPAVTDDVIIHSGTPIIYGAAVAHDVSIHGGVLTVGTSGSLGGAGSIQIQGDVTVQNNGSINKPVSVVSGTLFATGTWNGSVTVNSLATFHTSDSTRVMGDFVISPLGTLEGPADFWFSGGTFLNNGTVAAIELKFNRPGTQHLGGTGAWVNGGNLRVSAGSTTSLVDDLSMSSQVYIEGWGALDFNDHILTMNGDVKFSITCPDVGHAAGAGMLRTRGHVTVSNCGTFSPLLQIDTGTAIASGVYSGSLQIHAGATLTVTNQTVYGNASIGGILTSANVSSIFNFAGNIFANDGAVAVPIVNFIGSAQTLMGAGVFSPTTLVNVTAGAALALGSDHRMNKIRVHPNGRFDLQDHTLALTMSGVPLINDGTLLTEDSTIIYAGTAAQTLAYLNVPYHHLTISNTTAVAAPSTSLHVAGDLTVNGAFTPGASTFIFDGAAARQNIKGTTPIAFYNLTISNTHGVDLGVNASVTHTLILSGDLDTHLTQLTVPIAETTLGPGDVWGSFKRTGPYLPSMTYPLGNPNVTLRFNPIGTLPSNVAINLVKFPTIGLGNSIARFYSFMPEGGEQYQATLRLRYLDDEVPEGITDTQLHPWLLDVAQQRWLPMFKTAFDLSSNWIERSNVTGPSVWALAAYYKTYLPLIIR